MLSIFKKGTIGGQENSRRGQEKIKKRSKTGWERQISGWGLEWQKRGRSNVGAKPVSNPGFGEDIAGTGRVQFNFAAQVTDIDPQQVKLVGVTDTPDPS